MEAMDFMDPKRRLRHSIILAVGYVLIAIALLLITIILLFIAYGFGLQNGKVIQSGLLFLSSTPNPAQIYINGSRYKNDTNTKAILPAGTYNFDLKRAGYRDWSRSITVAGGQVQTYAYPFLFPVNLTATSVHNYASIPALTTESPDQHWLLVAQPGSSTSFDLYDLTNPQQAPTTVDIPVSLLAPSTNSQAISVVAWADDNDHILFKHTYDNNVEYILFQRSQPSSSVNLTKILNLSPENIDLRLSNNKYDQYIVYNTATHDVWRDNLSQPQLQSYLQNVLSFTTYGDNTVLYVTPDTTNPAKVDVMISDGSGTYTLRHDNANTTYLLDMATYSGDLYVGVSAASENTAFIYEDPIDQLSNQQLGVAIPVQVFGIKNPDYVAFSANAQYLLFESGTKMVTYDADNQQGFTFSVPDTLDAPQTHVAWMDSARLIYVSGGQVVVTDYDGQNRQVLVSADPRYTIAFDQSYKFMYALVPGAANKATELLTSTALLTPADQ